jgi:hypothetical protein
MKPTTIENPVKVDSTATVTYRGILYTLKKNKFNLFKTLLPTLSSEDIIKWLKSNNIK